MLFIILFLVGMVGVCTIWISLPIPTEEISPPLTISERLNLIIPTIILTFLLLIAVLAGVNLASQVGLSSPFAEALASGDAQLLSAIKPQLIPGLVGGVFGGVGGSALYFLWRSSLPTDFVANAEELFKNTPLMTRIFFGGITEEIILRWGLMTLLVWGSWRVLQKAQGSPHVVYVALAIGISALVFGMAHLPTAFELSSKVTASLVAYIVVGNSFFGLIAGYLYWQEGLEAAMIAHVTFHIVATMIEHVKSLRERA
jgi:hypothetical protein